MTGGRLRNIAATDATGMISDVIIPGYLDGYDPPIVRSPLVDGSEMMSSHLFWPAFLYTVGGSASAPAAFHVDTADLSEFIDVLLDPHDWPVFSMSLAGRSRLHIIMRNVEDDSGVDYLLDPDTGGNPIQLAAMDGHFRGPALAWPELVAAAQQPEQNHTVAERLLLLLPACADSDRPSLAVDMVAQALVALGACSNVRQTSMELLDNRRYWTSCQWTTVNGIRICLGPHAYRRPGSELAPADLRLITDVFAPPDVQHL
ncbi:hypothetical protein [Micromonospora echinofusca]|uniref:Uncharacterized protein n=1 Tax=Micromonospora echinofusca TaxID=47858 RepID=A0ABS3VYM5_MICEH|nr:hypothetical protein [Micromonospora echinofusca]MBO4209576.1 hypothetical protein [Micromonospora echinofusca]